MSVQEQADIEDTTDGSAAERGGEESSDNSKNSSDLQGIKNSCSGQG